MESISARNRSQKRTNNYLRKTLIQEIPTIVIDPHNEAFSFWYGHIKQINQGPAVLIHIDNHSDMFGGVESLECLMKSDPNLTIEDYSRKLGITSFIAPAVRYEILGPIYFFDPRKFPYIKSYGRVINKKFQDISKPVENQGIINWEDEYEYPPYEIIKTRDLFQDLRGYNGPIILDIDLDAFECVQDIECTESDRNLRLDQTFCLLKKLLKPNLITIARSQTPKAYCPPCILDHLETETIERLGSIYKTVSPSS